MRKRVRLCITGSEVMNGFVLDRNTQFFASELYALGLELVESRIIHDDAEQILSTWKEFVETGDIVVNSGGLGPTPDDLTVDLLCSWLGDSPVYEPYAEKRTRYFFEKRAKLFPGALSIETALRQTRVPSQATILKNKVGLAPGIFIPEKKFFALPGFPEEIRGMWHEVLEYVEALSPQRFATRIIPIWGVGESHLFSELPALEKISTGVHALPWGCRLFLRALSEEQSACDELETAVDAIQARFVGQIMENPLLEIIEFCKKQNLKLALAESCTGGLAAKQITDIPGVSAIFQGGVVSYANSVKTDALGVPEAVLEKFGAVSAEVARAMAEGVTKKLQADVGLSFTGIAGPDGGSSQKPVGTVFVGIHKAKTKQTMVGQFLFPLGRERFRNATVAAGFLALWQFLTEPNGGRVYPLNTFVE